ncbi:MAG: OmpH family outer membrane protein [Gammaproteobacteria bacterium]|nr:OmpH family outer membrane protein [Gammaproteobacteria bacterium]
MKNRSILLLALLLGLAVMTTVTAAELKFGFVDAARLLEESPQAQASSDILKKEFSEREERITKEVKDLKAIEERLARDGAIMAEAERSKLGTDLLGRQRKVRQEQQAFAEDLGNRRNEMMAVLQQQIQQAIVAIGKRDHFDLILYQGIAYANDGLDITGQVLDELKKTNKVK